MSIPALLAEGAAALGVALQAAETDALAAYLALLGTAGELQNLTGYSDAETMARQLVLDALAAWRVLPRHGDFRLVDLGSGAGIPGLPLAVTSPESRFVLVDAREKKARFIAEAGVRLGLGNVEVVARRAEDLGRDPTFREQADWVAAKALAPLNVLVELAVPLLRPRGSLLAWKGAQAEQEIAGAANALEQLGARVAAVHPYQLPGGDERRVLVEIRRVGPLSDRWPRRSGRPEKRPL